MCVCAYRFLKMRKSVCVCRQFMCIWIMYVCMKEDLQDSSSVVGSKPLTVKLLARLPSSRLEKGAVGSWLCVRRRRNHARRRLSERTALPRTCVRLWQHPFCREREKAGIRAHFLQRLLISRVISYGSESRDPGFQGRCNYLHDTRASYC